MPRWPEHAATVVDRPGQAHEGQTRWQCGERRAVLGSRGDDLREGFGYTLKRKLLGPPLVNEQLASERLSQPLALGVLSCDGISSANYGSELILHELLPFFGLAAFTILLPMTGVILLGIALVVLSYREVVTVYTRAGGSYVVARENFGPRVAQVAAVALHGRLRRHGGGADSAAGGGRGLGPPPYPGAEQPGRHHDSADRHRGYPPDGYGNLRGIRENGRVFACRPTCSPASVDVMIIVGLVREAFGGAGARDPYRGSGPSRSGTRTTALCTFGAIFFLRRAFANGGSSLTGIEAVSNAVSAFARPKATRPAGPGHRGQHPGVLVAGISWMAHVTHAAPYMTGVPTVMSQEAKIVFGQSRSWVTSCTSWSRRRPR